MKISFRIIKDRVIIVNVRSDIGVLGIIVGFYFFRY